jgi:serine/threonine protein kinase/WD40 repeat protein
MHADDDSALQALKLDAICLEFEHAWQRGDEPRIEAALEGLSPSQREQLLPQLLLIELECLQRSRVVPDVEEYVKRFPKDATLVRLALRAYESDFGATDNFQFSAVPIGSEIGRYKLLELIGEGGMGIVYMAEQQRPVRRKVALKIIKPGLDTKHVVTRFEAERQALAMMDHANIARVFDAGATDSGRPYFVMELVRGIPITEYCDRNKLAARERLKLFVLVCQAVQHAHTKGIIHRDLKPTNVLVTLHDGVPVPKIIDFGVAKATGQRLTERTLFTAFSQMIGTPLYMSPEQAELSGLDVDTRSDIYSLGVLLYELLTGTTPFDRQRLQTAAFDEVRRIIREEDPVKPSTRVSTMGESGVTASAQRATDPAKLKQLLRGELDWIVMKTLEKDRNRRYDTPSALAADVTRYLNDDPVEACPASATYRIRKFVGRHKSKVAIGCGFLALVLISTVASWILYAQARLARNNAIANEKALIVERDRARDEKKRAESEKSRADQQASELQRRLYDLHIINAASAHVADNVKVALIHLSECPFEYRRWEWHRLDYLLRHEITVEHKVPEQPFMGAIPSPDGSRIAVFGDDGVVRLIEASSGKEVLVDSGEHRLVRGLSFSRDGELLCVARWNKQPVKKTDIDDSCQSDLRVLQITTGKTLWQLPETTGLIGAADFSSNRQHLALWRGGNRPVQGRVELRSANTGDEIWSMPEERWVYSITFSPDGQSMYLNFVSEFFQSRSSSLAAWKTANHEQVWSVDRPFASWIAVSPDGKWILTGGSKHSVQIWDAATGEKVDELSNPMANAPRLALDEGNNVGYLVFSHDGNRFLSRCGLGITVWDWHARQPLRTLKQPRSWNTTHTHFSANDRHLILADSRFGSSVVLRDIKPAGTEVTMAGHEGPVRAVQFSADGHELISVGMDGTVRTWDVSTGQETWTEVVSADGVFGIAYSPRSDSFVTASRDGVKLWDTTTKRLDHHWSDFGPAKCVSFSEDGSRLVAGGSCLTVWNLLDRRKTVRHEMVGEVLGVRFMRDRKCVLAIDDAGTIDLLEIDSDVRKRIRTSTRTSLELLHDKATHQWTERLATDPVGRRIAAGIRNHIELWDIDNGLQKTFSNDDSIQCLGFDRDGSRLFSGDAAGYLTVWNMESGERLLQQQTGQEVVNSVALSPDGSTLATAGEDGTIKLWETRRPSENLAAQRDIVAVASKIVDSKYAGAKSPADVLSSLRSDPAIDQQVLPVALEIANTRGDRPRSIRIATSNNNK